jgi:hypothetical protein
MKKELERAINNIRIVVGNARMTEKEHDQLKNDINIIIEELNKKDKKKK